MSKIRVRNVNELSPEEFSSLPKHVQLQAIIRGNQPKSQLQIIRNDNGDAVLLTGLLPNGTYGQAGDTERPFTEAELNDADLFNKHLEDLNKRIGI